MSSCGVPKSGRGSGADWLLIFTEGVRCHSITDFLLLGCLKNRSNLISSPDLEGALRKGLLWRNDLGFSNSFDDPVHLPWVSLPWNTDFPRYYYIYFFISISVTLSHLPVGLCWVFVATRRLSLSVANGGGVGGPAPPSLRGTGFWLRWLLLFL